MVISRYLRATVGKLRTLYSRSQPRATNPYGTHVPILVGLGRTLRITSVLELGCGHYSTLLFLNHRAFLYLEKLDSYENDLKWFQTISAQVQGDSRAQFFFREQRMYEVVKDIDLSLYDLIFIDDSTSLELRTQTIQAIASQRERIKGLVVIHDYEQLNYRKASRHFRQKFHFRDCNPEVGILWQQLPDMKAKCKTIHQIIRRNASTKTPEDIEEWIDIFQNSPIDQALVQKHCNNA